MATVFVCGLLVAAGLTAISVPIYQSNTQFFVSTAGSQDSTQLAQGSTFTQQRVKSYTQLITTPRVLDPVIESLDLNTNSDALAARISAVVPPDTVLINVSVRDTSAQQAQAIADVIARQFPQTVDDLERVSGSFSSPVKVTVVKPADLAPNPVAPRPERNIALGGLLGLLLGVGIVVLRSALDNRVHTKEDVEAISTTPIIGAIPFDSSAPKTPLVVSAESRNLRAEAFRTLRTNLQFVDAANHPRIVTLTSSMAGEGKSTTSANLALTMAQSGARVCLIEGDLRRPRLLDYLGMEGGVGLTDVLIGRAELSDVVQPFGTGNLHVLGAGAIPPNPSELLASEAMRETLSTLASMYTHVLIDAPPLLPVTDAAVLTTLVDGAIVVVGSRLVTKDQLTAAIESLESVNGTVLGLVLNRVPKASGGYYHYTYEPRTTLTKGRRRRREKVGADS